MKKVFKKVVIWALQKEAKWMLKKWQPKIIGITGSVGKTSTKDAVFSAFSACTTIIKSEKSFNSEIGIPLTILGLKNAWNNPLYWIWNIKIGFLKCIFSIPKAEWLVLEVGADRPGDIKKIVEWINFDTVIINKVDKTPVHVEFFESPEEVAKEKSNLIKGLKTNGILLLNGDEEITRKMGQGAEGKKVFYFGFGDNSQIKASNYEISYKEKDGVRKPIGFSFKVNYQGKSFPVFVEGALGVHHVYPVLSAIGVSIANSLNVLEAIEGLRKHKTPLGRMKIIDGIKNSTILDDSYNASPTATEEALKTLSSIQNNGQKIALLGDMRELGKYSKEAHKKIGRIAKDICNLICCVGEESKFIVEGALESGFSEKNILHFEKSEEAGKYIQNIIKEGDIILVKGSQSIRMEKITLEIMAKPEDAENLLVRQEKEWQKR